MAFLEGVGDTWLWGDQQAPRPHGDSVCGLVNFVPGFFLCLQQGSYLLFIPTFKVLKKIKLLFL